MCSGLLMLYLMIIHAFGEIVSHVFCNKGTVRCGFPYCTPLKLSYSLPANTPVLIAQ